MAEKASTRDQFEAKTRRQDHLWLILVSLVPGALFILWLLLDLHSDHLSTAKLDAEIRIFDILLKITSISTLIVGAWWSYRSFFRQRLKEARLNVDHQIAWLSLPNGDHLVKVYATVANIGQVKVVLKCWRLCAEQILPLTDPQGRFAHNAFTDKEFGWPSVADGVFSNDKVPEAFWILLEPGEKDQAAGNLIVPAQSEVVQVYSHFSLTLEEGSQGWESRALVDFRESTDKIKEEQMSEHQPKDKPGIDIRPASDDYSKRQQHHTPPVKTGVGNQNGGTGTGPKAG